MIKLTLRKREGGIRCHCSYQEQTDAYFGLSSPVGTKDNGQAGSGGEEDGSGTPPIPPRRKDKRRHNTPPRPQSNGLPPTPKVHMGACFSKVGLSRSLLPR